MKTAIIFNQFDEGITYHVFNGDYSHLHRIYINGDPEEELTDELNALIHDKEGYAEVGKVDIDKFAKEIESGAKLIECGFYL